MNKKLFFSIVFAALLSVVSTFGQQGCSGQFKTFTIGGWGTNCNGNNPGCYRDAHFEGAFPDGLSIGCGNNTISLTSSSAVANFLPSGGPSTVLSGNSVNPTSSIHNTLASQLIAITLAIGFDVYDPNFSTSTTSFSSLTIKNGIFQGMSVGDFLQVANQVIGGCSTQYSLSSLNTAATAINENFDNGTVDNGYLNCSRPFNLTVTVGIDPTVCGSDNSLVTITINGGAPVYAIKVYKNNVLVSTMNSNDAVVYLSGLGAGSFSVEVTDSNGNVATGTW